MVRQRVLTIPADSVAELYEGAAFYSDTMHVDTAQKAIDGGSFIDRDAAENNHDVKQIVACAIVRSDSRILCVRRSSKSDRKSLRLRHTLILGGHVDESDAGEPSILERCVVRELSEELGITVTQPPQVIGVVADPFTLVGSLHLGVVFEVRLARQYVELSPDLDTAEFVRDGQRRVIDFLPFSEVKRIERRLDPWSKLFFIGQYFQLLLGSRGPNGGFRQLLVPYND